MATLKRWSGTAWVPVGADTFLGKQEASQSYAPVDAVQKIDSAGTVTPAQFAVRLDANGDVDALVLNGVDL